jgi:hypothetical protein
VDSIAIWVFRAWGMTHSFETNECIENRKEWLYCQLLFMDVQNFFEAHTKYQSGASTCLFIGSSVFSNLKKGKAPADHWVVLNSAITLDGKLASSIKPLYANNTINSDDIMKMKIDFNVYTWGRANYKITTLSKSLTVNEFLDYFYGYVSAK